MLKILQPGFNSTWTENFQMFKLDLEKTEEPEIKLPTFTGSSKKQEFQKNIYLCFINYVKDFDCVDHNKLWKILKVMGPDAMILVFWMLSFKPTFSLSSFTFIKRFFSSSLLSAVRT